MTGNNEDKIIKDTKLKKKSIIKEWIIDIAAIAFVAFLLWQFVGYGVWITSGSMIPTLEVKDRLIVTRVHNTDNLKSGDIVLFKNDEFEGEVLIKRLIGLPGDKIEIKDDVVFRNGEQLKEDYVNDKEKNSDKYNGKFEIPEGKYFFLGDNREHSNDSRYWKDPYVDESDIVGKARIKYYPIKDFEILK